MAECSEQSRLEAYHDDELSDADRAAFEAHLRACPSCAAELESLRAMSNPLRDFRTERLSEISLQRLHQQFDEEIGDDTRFIRFAQTLGIIAASVLLIGVAWLKALPASAPRNTLAQPTSPLVVSPLRMKPWERSAITLRPDPSTVPMNDPNDPEDSRSRVAQLMVDGLKPQSEQR